MTPAEIMNGLQARNRELSSKNDELIQLTESAAEAKREYLIAMASKTTELRLAGEPIGIIRDLIKGDKAVANLQYKWDIADGVLLACRERIKDIREAIGTYRSILTWLREELRTTPNQEM